MKQVITNVYQFDELSEKAKEKAISDNYDVNIFDQWWDSVYDDAETIGLRITGFDIDRASYVNADFTGTAAETANLILENHGEGCETYKTAKRFINDCKELQNKAENEGKDGDEDYWFSDEIEKLEDDFLQSLCEDYRIILSNEYEYLTSDEAIKETLIANEYEFTIDGKRF